MTADIIPATTRIKTRSIPNVSTDRLLDRLGWYRAEWSAFARGCEQKNEVRQRARELVNIERELARREVPFDPASDGRHLSIDVWTLREIRP